MNAIKFYCLIRARTHERPAFEKVLDAIEEEPLFVPTHASPNERKRKPYDRGTLLDEVFGPNGSPPYFWRTKAPKYTHAVIGMEATSINLVSFTFEEPVATLRQPIIEAASRLVERLPTEFAFVHVPAPKEWPHSAIYNAASAFRAVILWRKGIPNLFARTWFGKSLIEHVGRDLLLSIKGASTTASGDIAIELVPEPWGSGLDTLFAAQQQALVPLRERGLLLETGSSGIPDNWQRAPNWTAPPWEMGKWKWER